MKITWILVAAIAFSLASAVEMPNQTPDHSQWLAKSGKKDKEKKEDEEEGTIVRTRTLRDSFRLLVGSGKKDNEKKRIDFSLDCNKMSWSEI